MSEPEGLLRLLRREDVASAFELSAKAGWNQTQDDWLMLLQLAPESCWGIEIDGTVVATTTLLCYGRKLAWIGMVLTRVEFQRRGLAKQLFARALSHADEMGIETIKLDATDQGQKLYEAFGFRGEREIERWVRPGDDSKPSQSAAQPAVSSDFDTECFGADRSELLNNLAQRGSLHSESGAHLFARAGRANAYLGPCVAKSTGVVRRLIELRVQVTACGWAWDLFPSNTEAAAIARDLGFAPKRHLLRMARGKHLWENVNSIYAIAGFELG